MTITRVMIMPMVVRRELDHLKDVGVSKGDDGNDGNDG